MNREVEEMAAFLQKKRICENITQKEQAEKIGIPPAELTRIIKGKRPLAKKLFQKIIDAYPEDSAEIKKTQISAEEIGRAETLKKEGVETRNAEQIAGFLKYGI
jgi:transcriptional regulator with XRE-family HTH domain